MLQRNVIIVFGACNLTGFLRQFGCCDIDVCIRLTQCLSGELYQHALHVRRINGPPDLYAVIQHEPPCSISQIGRLDPADADRRQPGLQFFGLSHASPALLSSACAALAASISDGRRESRPRFDREPLAVSLCYPDSKCENTHSRQIVFNLAIRIADVFRLAETALQHNDLCWNLGVAN